MPLTLMQSSGACINLGQGGSIQLGRQHVTRTVAGASHVSRVQCEVSCPPSGRHDLLLLTSKSEHNPTGVYFGASGAQHRQGMQLLQAGESTQLQVGDRILLLTTQLDQFLEVMDLAEASGDETTQPPPHKRPRLTPSCDIPITNSQPRLSPSMSVEPAIASQDDTDSEIAEDVTAPSIALAHAEAADSTLGATDTITSGKTPQTHTPDLGQSNNPLSCATDCKVNAVSLPSHGDELTSGVELSSSTAVADSGESPAQHAAAAASEAAAVTAGPQPVIVILVGVPGSGKSTFCAQLIAKGSTSWVRVNQDSINSGRRGSKQQCLAAARAAVLAGHSCVVDRCHQDAQQRSDFIKLAASLHREAHAVVLGLPAKVCASRAAARVDHEGGVQGPTAPRVVQMMHSQLTKAGPPSKAEGLASIMVCRSDTDVKSALQAWCAYGQPGSAPPAALFQPANPLQRAFASSKGKAASNAASSASYQLQQGQEGSQQEAKQQPPVKYSHSPGAADVANDQLPSVFAHVSAQVLSSASPQHGTQLESNQSVSAGTALPHQRGASDQQHLAGDVPTGAVVGAQQPSQPQLQSCKASSEPTEHQQKAPASSQNAFAVMMRASKGVTTACTTGKSSADLSTNRTNVNGALQGPTAVGGSSQGRQVSSKRPRGEGTDGSGAGVNISVTTEGTSGSRPTGAGSVGRSGFQAGWQGALQRVAANPERHRDQYPEMQIYGDCVVINDAFPKARCHALVIARQEGLDGPADLRAQHLPLLHNMQVAAEHYIERMQTAWAADPARRLDDFKIGFHTIPSMSQLHMHVISQDFDSASLKNKKHWNSFTTAFFFEASTAAMQLQSNSCLSIDVHKAESLLKNDLLCHICHKPMKNMPFLKSHIRTCKDSKH